MQCDVQIDIGIRADELGTNLGSQNSNSSSGIGIPRIVSILLLWNSNYILRIAIPRFSILLNIYFK
jgi:hypothetical protein